MAPESRDSQCPLCSKPNDCRVDAAGGCWCFDVTIPPATLERARRACENACLCRDCATRKQLGVDVSALGD